MIMDFSSVLLFLLIATTIISSSSSVNVEFWKLQDPLWDYGGNEFELNYKFNDAVEHTMIRYAFYDKNCQLGDVPIPIMGGTGYTIDITNDGKTMGDGSSTRGYKVKFKPTATINENSIIYGGDYQDENGNYFANVELCARVSLYTEQGIEVNFLESIMSVKYMFTESGLSIADVNVQRPLLDLANVELGVKLRAYDCSMTGDGFLSQGMVIRVCVEPIQEAVLDGFRMKAIEWFTYSKPSINITQEAVIDRQQAPNELSRLTCIQGTAQCVVETMLFGAFFAGNGTVEAAGLATMQLGTHSSDDVLEEGRRSLRVRGGDNKRMLQVAAETVSKEFDIPFDVIGNDNYDAATNSLPSFLNEATDRIDSEGNSLAASIMIIMLIFFNVVTLFVLTFQHNYFKGTWFYFV